MQKTFQNIIEACCIIAVLVLGLFLFDIFHIRTWVANKAFEAQHFQSAYFLNPDDATLLVKIGHYYLQENQNLPRAVSAYTLALSVDPTIPFAHHQLARIYFIQGDFTSARREIREELARDENNFRSIYVQALIEAYSGNMSGAEEGFRKVVARAPTRWGGYNDLAWVLAEQEKFNESVDVARAGIQLSTNGATNPWLWNALGVALFHSNEYALAKDSFTKASEYVENVTEEEWHMAYSANTRSSASVGLSSFKAEIQTNITATENRFNERR